MMTDDLNLSMISIIIYQKCSTIITLIFNESLDVFWKFKFQTLFTWLKLHYFYTNFWPQSKSLNERKLSLFRVSRGKTFHSFSLTAAEIVGKVFAAKKLFYSINLHLFIANICYLEQIFMTQIALIIFLSFSEIASCFYHSHYFLVGKDVHVSRMKFQY